MFYKYNEMKKFFRYLRTRSLAFVGSLILAFLYLIMIFAEGE